ncbi:MAG: [FeFe] hydrogenase H-cluster radical SAM maturase HydE [Bacteroidales bacterium]|nr:[FeFe] hydrogenase H-cluster radical SAM maturase HydE [Bacteroidales bacterium]
MDVEDLKKSPGREQLAAWLSTEDPEQTAQLLAAAAAAKRETLGDAVHLRGLIELSNICVKNCLYCGIRCANTKVKRYDLTDAQVLQATAFARDARYGSLVIQSGERTGTAFVKRIEHLVRKIKQQTNNELGITLSCGEQSYETYRRWYGAGAHRYLLRIEATNPKLYAAIHPNDGRHRYEARLQALHNLQKARFQTGTGVMIGLPGQTAYDLADDLLFFKDFDVDMVGMGPYLEHEDTPIYELRQQLLPQEERLSLTLKMIALLRLMMTDINIAATTAMQAIDPFGRERAVLAGANIIMPNMTVSGVRHNYQIYDHKPGIDDDAELSKSHLEENLGKMGIRIAWDEWGDSKHFYKKREKFAPN